MRVWCVLALLPGLCFAQLAGRTARKEAGANARISGTVLSDVTGEPLSRARVLLRSAGGETGSVAVEAEDNGSFVIPSVVPGKYSISAQRDGYLTGTAAFTGTTRLPAVMLVESGKRLSGVTFRLKRWSVVAGHIRFSDAEPAVGVLVQLFQDTHSRGRRGFRMVSFTRTNDHGEYRVPGLSAGSYYVAASYDRPLAPEFQAQDPVDESGKELPQFRYSTTFYPSAQKLSEALAIKVGSSEESSGVDIFLQPVRTLRIRGMALSGLTGEAVKAPSLNLRRLSADERSSINAAVSITPRGNGFEMRGVTSGPYLLIADTLEKGRRLFARVPLLITDANIDDLQVLLVPERTWQGTIKVVDAPNLRMTNLRVLLEPRSDLNPITAADVKAGGIFSINVVPDEVYDAYIVNAPDEVFIKSVRIANSPVDTAGISGQMAGANVPLEITLAGKDGSLAGRTWNNDGTPAPSATVTVVPDPSYGRPQLVRTSSADTNGLYQVRGLASGKYNAYVYYDTPPCDFYDPDSLAECSARATSFTVEEGAQSVLGLWLPR